MAQKKSNESDVRIGFIISQIIITAFLIVDIYIFINQDSIIAKSFATVSFVGFMFLLISSLKATLKLKG
ncbi:hypothetical protein [Psychrobacillus lasiicapitis]|uniref:Uncharacterized protein n=1 Tax=Psychrobacillus lasiicapitis TaxID=1636719 RepID=A0A544TI46_9BACI|nr:hypothetical protein [Psychrobacillus lasiicapitis]TQR17126.1 hypothetical protein FG382_02995 [Psychrobacillus lasiicapitis]GGA24244.1 hypothetical protein GCM10011384_11800 [Psychrobacillus lasiicapitis]